MTPDQLAKSGTEHGRQVAKKHIGCHSELVACAWLLRNGYEVFRNISAHGMMDIIAIKDDVMLKIDVKTIQRVKGSSYFIKLTQEQIDYGVISLNVNPETGECEFDFEPKAVQSTGICIVCRKPFRKYNFRQKKCSNLCEVE